MKPSLILSTLCAAAAFAAAPAAAAPAEAYVLAVEGAWSLQGQERHLTVGSAVPLPATLRSRKAAPGDRIVVVARTGAILMSHDCAQPTACRRPVAIAGSADPAARDTLADALQRVMARLEGTPSRYVVTLSRDDGAAPRDAVLALGDGPLDPAAALAAVPAGRYELRLQATDCAAAPACDARAATATLDWRPGGGAAVVPSAGLEPGMYSLGIRRLDVAAPALPRHARLLLVAASDWPLRAARFAQWQALVEVWPAAVDALARQRVLRAALDEVAAGP